MKVFSSQIKQFVFLLHALLVTPGVHLRGAMLGGHSALGAGVRKLPFGKISEGVKDALLHSSPVIPNKGLRVFWEGVKEPTQQDLLVLTCDMAEWRLEDAFDAIAVVGPHASGAGSSGWVDLPPLHDLRCDYIVRYVRALSPHEAEVVGETKLVHEAGAFGLLPSQAHIGFTSRRDEMLVIWVSGHNKPVPKVKWGYSSGDLVHEASGTSSTYHASDLCNAPANKTGPQNFFFPGWIHRAVLTGLSPSSKVFYRIGNELHGWSKERSFTSRRPADAKSVKFLMYADQALPVPLFAPAWRLVGQVLRDLDNGYDGFLLHPGDLGYAMGSTFIWDVWHGLVEPITSRVPYMVTVGNHEYDHIGSRLDPSGAPPAGWHPQDGPGNETWGNFGDDSRGECGVPVAARFNGTGGGNGVFWYSFDEASVHVVVMSSEHDWRRGSEQYLWLQADLAAVNRTATPWIVLATHRMMYTTQLQEEGDYKVSLAFRDHVEPLLYKYRVNLMLVGHQHSYERSCAAYNGTCIEDGRSATVHIVVGSAGASAERGGFSPSLGNFSLKHVNDYGYLRLDADPSRMLVEMVRTNAHDGAKAGEVWDSIELTPWLD